MYKFVNGGAASLEKVSSGIDGKLWLSETDVVSGTKEIKGG